MYDYNIDLSEVKETMTYRHFNILLRNLSSESPLGKLIEIRKWKPVRNYKHERNKQESTMRKLQQEYALRSN